MHLYTWRSILKLIDIKCTLTFIVCKAVTLTLHFREGCKMHQDSGSLPDRGAPGSEFRVHAPHCSSAHWDVAAELTSTHTGHRWGTSNSRSRCAWTKGIKYIVSRGSATSYLIFFQAQKETKSNIPHQSGYSWWKPRTLSLSLVGGYSLSKHHTSL